MRKLWLILGIFAAPLILPLMYALMAFITLSILGYHPDAVGQELAIELVEKNRRPDECLWIIHPLPHPLSPSAGEQRANCLYEYAKLTRDPSACELLLPGEYGFSCIGAAESMESLCTIDFGRVIEWGSYLDGTHQRATLEECISGRLFSGLGRQCCVISKVTNLKKSNDCSSLSGTRGLYEECQAQLALKTGDPSHCDTISTMNSRTACTLRAKFKSALTTLPPPIDVESVPSAI